MDNVSVLLKELDSYINRFIKANEAFYTGVNSPDESEKLLADYTAFILEHENKKTWEESIDPKLPAIKSRIDAARIESAHCVWAMEKYRAMALLHSGDNTADYFKNIEGCIENEFGSFRPNKDSRILLIGVGAFPMTPLLIARNTGARVVGIDIDAGAVEYAKKVLDLLGPDLDIEVSTQTCAELKFTKEATHIIFASTIPEKFDILQDLYQLTNKDAVVLMRYGNGFKSLFNYPLLNVPDGLWKRAENICCENNVFDVALYTK